MQKQGRKGDFSWLRFGVTFTIMLVAFLGICVLLAFSFQSTRAAAFPVLKKSLPPDRVERVDSAFEKAWEVEGVKPAPEADFYTVARRLSLGLTGALPSLEEIRRLEATKPENRIDAWLDHLFSDRRYASYMAERFARVYVGTENGPFLVYRRRRMVNWLADQLAENRPYDEMARTIIASRGIWTTAPEANFITVSTMDGEKGGPDEIKLAARTSRAFLGVSLDCVQCHDDKFGDRWKQKDFHQLAAFFAQSEVALSGVWDNPKLNYETQFRGKAEAEQVSMKVPFQAELFSKRGSPRDQLASWITHPENRSFSRAVANRAWALLMGRPLVTPIDDIPIEGPVPAGLDALADEFVAVDHDLQTLFRIIAHSAPFLRSSTSQDPAEPVTIEQEKAWAAYPLTQLRPDQVSGSIIQAASVQALDSSSHIFKRAVRFFETNDFVKRYGDKGENEFTEGTGTIPQRLILMNGKLVDTRIEQNPLLSSTTRISVLAKDPAKAIETAFLAVLTRKPNPEEKAHFEAEIAGKKGDAKQRVLEDLYWALINSTEFSWNR